MHSFWKSLVDWFTDWFGAGGDVCQSRHGADEVGIISGTPLKIQIFQNNSLQVWHNRYHRRRQFWDGWQRLFHCPEYKHLRPLL